MSSNLEVVRAWMQAINGDDVEAAVALCDEAFEMTEPATLPGAATTSGHSGLRRYMRGWTRNWSEWKWQEPEALEFPPDHVLVVSDLWMRGLRSQIAVEHRWVYLFQIRDERLLRQDGFDDKAQALQAAGLRD